MKFFSILFSIPFFIGVLANAAVPPNINRINAPTDPATRCVTGVGDPNRCEAIRRRALDSGCINEQEYTTLKNYGSYPNCVDNGDGLVLGSWCSCGCFSVDTQILATQNGETQKKWTDALSIALDFSNYKLTHLSQNATLANMSVNESPILISTIGQEKKKMIEIKTQSTQLRVTETHPILKSDGTMVQAKNLAAGDSLVTIDGTPEFILSVNSQDANEKVVNFVANSQGKLGHIIFANGLAVGDLYWQASLEDELNQIAIRK